MSEIALQPLLPHVDRDPHATLIEREPTDEEGRHCIICLNSDSEEGEITRLFHAICHSGYHRDCIHTALTEIESKCPICKRSISVIQNLDGSEEVVPPKIQAVSAAYVEAVHQIPAEDVQAEGAGEEHSALTLLRIISVVFFALLFSPVILFVGALALLSSPCILIYHWGLRDRNQPEVENPPFVQLQPVEGPEGIPEAEAAQVV